MVRGVQQGFCWDPQVVARAMVERNSRHGMDKTIKVGRPWKFRSRSNKLASTSAVNADLRYCAAIIAHEAV